MYSTIQLVFFVLLVGVSVLAAPAKKNIVFKACHKSDPAFMQCFKSELQNVIPLLNDGYPKYRLPPLDPFDLPALDIAKGSGAVSVDLSLQKLKIYGLTSARLESLNLDVDTLKANAKFTFAKPISLIGQYTAKGKVQVLPINGKGPCNITMVDPVLELTDIQGEVRQKDGKNYIDLKGVTLKATKMGKLILKLENLFQGNKEVSDNLNVFLNENWELLFEELRPAFEEAVAVILKEVASKVLQKIPRDEIFPA
ncbi:protein takeout-like [Planococcus citri]|uniref:protein takeout-like n=1 Tax=Planococcus citri TaxID=170843 RepID=UPI0031F73990